MGLRFRGVSAAATGTISLSIAMPTGVVENDLMVMCLVHKGVGYATVPAGWTVVAQDIQGGVTRGEMYWKRAGAGEAGPYSITGLADTAMGAIVAYSGAKLTGSPVDQVVTRANAVGTNGTGDFQPTAEECVLVAAACLGDNNQFPTNARLRDTATGVSVWDMRTRISAVTANGTDCGLGVFETLWRIPAQTSGFAYNETNQASVAILASFLPESTGLPASANRFYLTKRPLGTRYTGPPQGTGWVAGDSTRNNRGKYGTPNFLLHPDPVGGGDVASEFYSTAVGVANEDLFGRRWLTPPLQAQTLGGTIDLCIGASKFDVAPASGVLVIDVYVVPPGTTVQGGTPLISHAVQATALTQTLTYRGLDAPLALPAVAVTAGSRLAVEVGARCSPFDSTTSNGFTLAFGVSLADSHVPYQDAVVGNAVSSTPGAAWVDFSQALVLDTTAPPAISNVDCASASVIAAAPYDSGLIDTTACQGAHRGVWWQFTPSVSGRYFVSTLGGNYGTMVRVWEGVCGALSKVSASITANERLVAWLGTSQTMNFWDAVAGTTYWIEVQSYTTAATENDATAFDSGGALRMQLWIRQAPQTGDLFVSAKHIAVLRNATFINELSEFYSSQPTGSAVDYTRRPLDDLNGGQDTSLRLYVGFFGTNPDIEIFDLATLNNGELEIDFIFAAIATGGQNLSTTVFDKSGRLILGWYGDNYSVLGSLSTPEACKIRRLDATHADNQAGAPWPDAEEYQVDQERGGTDFVELDASNDVCYYTSAGWRILRWSFTQGQLSDFASVPPFSAPRPYLRSVRLLPPGDGTGGVLVAAGDRVLRLDAAGVITQTYQPPGSASDRAQDLDKIEFDATAATFWVSDQYSCSLFHFDLTSGALLHDVDTGLPPGQCCGFSVYNGYRAGVITPPPPITVPACPPPGNWLDPTSGGCVAVGEL